MVVILETKLWSLKSNKKSININLTVSSLLSIFKKPTLKQHASYNYYKKTLAESLYIENPATLSLSLLRVTIDASLTGTLIPFDMSKSIMCSHLCKMVYDNMCLTPAMQAIANSSSVPLVI